MRIIGLWLLWYCKQMRKIAAIYTRVSTDQQEQGESPETQYELCKQFAIAKGFTEFKVFDQDANKPIPGTVLDRPGIRALTQFLRENNDCKDVFIYHMNRIARSNKVMFTIIEDLVIDLGITLHSQAERNFINAENYNLTSVIGMVMGAEDYQQTIRRFKVTKENARKIGKPINGATPLGYKRINLGTIRDKKTNFVKDKEFEEIVLLILREYQKPKASINSLMTLVNNLGYRRNGRLYTRMMVYGILQSAFTYSGFYYQGVTRPKRKMANNHTRVQRKPLPEILAMIRSGEVVPFTAIEPYITRAEAEFIFEKLISNQKMMSGRKTQSEALFRGMVYCGWCGRKGALDGKRRKDGSEYAYYSSVCQSRGLQNPNSFVPCVGFKMIPNIKYDDKIYVAIIESFQSFDFTEILKYAVPDDNEIVRNQAQGIEQQLLEINKRMEQFEADYSQGFINGNQLNKATETNNLARIALEKQLNDLAPKIKQIDSHQTNVSYLAENASAIVERLLTATDYASRRLLLEELGTRIYVKDTEMQIQVKGIALGHNKEN
jgi:DNA invertase Pin-like site-specific DNA recombinase